MRSLLERKKEDRRFIPITDDGRNKEGIKEFQQTIDLTPSVENIRR
jgi:hypothetical protein